MQSHVITSQRAKEILLDLNLSSKNNLPLVIFSHGFKGFKDWGPFNEVSNQFVNEGLNFLKFNFSYNGVTVEDPTNFVDLEAFGNNNFTIELEDLESIINWSLEYLEDKVDTNQIYLMGHSRGGGISILKSSHNKHIKKVVSWASVSDFERRIINDKLDLWKERGVAYVFNGRTNQQMPLYYQFYEDFMRNKESLSIEKASKSLQIPLLVVHGDNDETVYFREAEELNSWAKHSSLLKIENCDHVFNAKHPFDSQSMPKELKLAIEESISFFKS
ncbi:MAG: prolyl oligopeptidase family serine peptidase [Flavobacteriales bacterium]|nr:prolyl oligopeptidase family serine peptidase [Flavobacteriales bacterium]